MHKILLVFIAVGATTASAARAGDCDSLNGTGFTYIGDPGGSSFFDALNNGELFTLNVADIVTIDFTLPPGATADVSVGADTISKSNQTNAQQHIVEQVVIPDSGGDGSPTVGTIPISGSTADADTIQIDFLCTEGAGDAGDNAAAQSNAFVENTAIGFGGDLPLDFGIPGSPFDPPIIAPIGNFPAAPGGLVNPVGPGAQGGFVEAEDFGESSFTIFEGDPEEDFRRQQRVRRTARKLNRGEEPSPEELAEFGFEINQETSRRAPNSPEEPVFSDEDFVELQELSDRFETFTSSRDQLERDFNESDQLAPNTEFGDGDLIELLEDFSESLAEASGEQNEALEDLFEENESLRDEIEFLDENSIGTLVERAQEERQNIENESLDLDREIQQLEEVQNGLDPDVVDDPFDPSGRLRARDRFTQEELDNPEAAIAERRQRQQQLQARDAQIDQELNDKIQDAADRVGVQIDSQFSANDSEDALLNNPEVRNFEETRNNARQDNQNSLFLNEAQIFDGVQQQSDGVDPQTRSRAIDDAARDFSGFGEQAPPPVSDLQALLIPDDSAEPRTAFASLQIAPSDHGVAFSYAAQPQAIDPRLDVWIAGDVVFTDDNRTGVAADATSLFLKTGARYRVHPDLALGGALRYAHNESEQDDGSAEFNGDAFGVAAFAQSRYQGVDMQATIAYERGQVDAVIGGATGDFGVDTFSGQIEASRAIALTPEWNLIPNAALSYTVADRDGYTLSDGTVVPSDTLQQGSAALGARLSGGFDLDSGFVTRLEPSLGASAIWNFTALEPGVLADGSRVDSARLGFRADVGLTAHLAGGAQASLTAAAGRFDGDEIGDYSIGARIDIPLN